jgi:hypothetical protein
VQPVTFQDLRPPSLLAQQQVENPDTDSEIETVTGNEAAYQIANYVGHLIFVEERPFIVVAIASIVLGLLILVGPFRGARVTFDKTQQQVELKQARWFFLSATEHHPFDELYEVRIERDRLKNRPDKSFGAVLVFSNHEGTPLSQDYINYKTVFPLSESFRYDYHYVETIIERIRVFMADFRRY